jgi:hypothetical protein
VGLMGTVLVVVAVCAVVAAPSAGAAAPASIGRPTLAGPDRTRHWTVTETVDPSPQANYLTSTLSFSRSNTWAVGAWYRPDLSTPGTLTEHWNGSAWKLVPSPNVTEGYNELNDVDGAGPHDMWAVGFDNISYYGSERTLALHWNGRRWSVVDTPNLGTTANMLQGVTAISRQEAWAVGFGNDGGGFQGDAIAEHWNGTKWQLVDVAPPGAKGSSLSAVDALAPDDVWAVGAHVDKTLVEHYDGAAWTVVPSPNGDGAESSLSAVVAIGPDDVWAAGESGGDAGPGATDEATLVLHWDGTDWSVVPSPNGPQPSNVIGSLTAFGSDSVWAAGSSYDDLNVTSQSLVERWDGSRWRMVDSPNPDPEYTWLGGVGGIDARHLWTVGAQGSRTLAMHR